jgi:hypothetical protein
VTEILDRFTAEELVEMKLAEHYFSAGEVAENDRAAWMISALSAMQGSKPAERIMAKLWQRLTG